MGIMAIPVKMFIIGNQPSILAKRVTQVAHECMWLGIEQVKPGALLGDIGYAIEKHAKQNRFSSVHDFCGHGIGENFHEAPDVMHFGEPRDGHGITGRHDLHH